MLSKKNVASAVCSTFTTFSFKKKRQTPESSPVRNSTKRETLLLSSTIVSSCPGQRSTRLRVCFISTNSFTLSIRKILAPQPLSVPHSLPIGYSVSFIFKCTSTCDFMSIFICNFHDLIHSFSFYGTQELRKLYL